jgi:hypothetical protein
VGVAALGVAAFGTSAQAAAPVAVFVGYADSLRGADASFPTPWQGAMNLRFVGGPGPWDGGAIRLDNPSTSSLHVDRVAVDLGRPGPVLSPWPAFDIPAESSAILTQMTAGDFDTSEFAFQPCGVSAPASDPRIPRIAVTAGGIESDFLDTGHVLDTGGFDLDCQAQGNESLQWRAVGGPGIASRGSTLSLSGPAPGAAQVPGTPASLTAIALDAGGQPLADAAVHFSVSEGPDVGFQRDAVTDAAGRAPFALLGKLTGVDEVIAALPNASGASVRTPAAVPVRWTLPPPVPSSTVDVGPASGTVRIARPGSANFVPLGAERPVAVGSSVDARRGTITLTGTTPGAAPASGRFSGGSFTISQPRGARGLLSLRLRTAANAQRACSAAASGRARAARTLSTRVLALLRSAAHGRFRTTGRFAAATVRGTRWTIADRCDGTLVRVFSGRVAVNDFVRHVTVTVSAGHSYLAHAGP